MVTYCMFLYGLAITVMFDNTTYSVNEGDGQAQPVVVLTRSSSTNISVEITVSSMDGSATGEYVI